MANVSSINGFRPVKHLTGAPYNGQATLYAHSASDSTALFVGDVVQLDPNTQAYGLQCVKAATAGVAGTGLPVLGVIVGIINNKLDVINGTVSTGSIALDTPQYVAASTAAYVLVADSPDIVFETEATSGGNSYTFAVGDVANNVNLFAGAGSTSTGNSQYSADFGDKSISTTTLPFRVLQAVLKVGNTTSGGTATKVLVKINNHQFGNATAGV